MRLLLAADSVTTLDILLAEVLTRSWPNGTEARVLSIVEDGEVARETWRARRAHCSVRIVRGRTASRDGNLLPHSSNTTIRTPVKASWLAHDFGKRKAA